MLTIHWSTKSPSHDIKKIPNVGFNTTEDDPTVLIAEVSSHRSHECDLQKSSPYSGSCSQKAHVYSNQVPIFSCICSLFIFLTEMFF